jgi:hypothetical protein
MEAHSSFYQRQEQKLIENGTHWKPLNQIQLELIKSIENITEILEIFKIPQKKIPSTLTNRPWTPTFMMLIRQQ